MKAQEAEDAALAATLHQQGVQQRADWQLALNLQSGFPVPQQQQDWQAYGPATPPTASTAPVASTLGPLVSLSAGAATAAVAAFTHTGELSSGCQVQCCRQETAQHWMWQGSGQART